MFYLIFNLIINNKNLTIKDNLNDILNLKLLCKDINLSIDTIKNYLLFNKINNICNELLLFYPNFKYSIQNSNDLLWFINFFIYNIFNNNKYFDYMIRLRQDKKNDIFNPLKNYRPIFQIINEKKIKNSRLLSGLLDYYCGMKSPIYFNNLYD